MTKRREIAKLGAKKASTMDSDSWCSPHSVADGLVDFFGGPVGTDPCSNPNSIIKARRAFHAGGLHLSWTRPKDPPTAYRNNPYSDTLPWICKAVREMHKPELPLEEEVGLVMVATSTEWWRKMCGVEPVLVQPDTFGKLTRNYKHTGKLLELRPRNPRLLFTGRLKFLGDADNGARFDTVLTYYGPRAERFDRVFKHLTKWSTWGRSGK